MGAMAESIVAYTQPLIDGTDGSHEEMERALGLGQLCWNLALLPEDKREASIAKLKSGLHMDDEECRLFRLDIIDPMIQRHREMFPRLHARRANPGFADFESAPKTAEAYPGTDRYAPCPCNSGRKYKFCCGKSR